MKNVNKYATFNGGGGLILFSFCKLNENIK